MLLNKLRLIKRSFSCYMLILPSLVLISVFCYVPFFWAFKSSLYQHEIGGQSEFIGLSNYREYLGDPTFLSSFGNMLFLTIFAVCVNIISPLVLAKLIFSLSSQRARYFFRIIFLIPIVVPVVAVQMIWQSAIYHYDMGVINFVLRNIGLEHLATGWLTSPDTVLLAIAFIGFPWASGINILIFYAGLTAIPESVHEAANLDGAGGGKKVPRH